jgi:hypothetical protein
VVQASAGALAGAGERARVVNLAASGEVSLEAFSKAAVSSRAEMQALRIRAPVATRLETQAPKVSLAVAISKAETPVGRKVI